MKLAWLWPAGTVTAGGTCAADGLLVESDTDAPPGGAAPLRTTMPPTLAPPVTLPAPSITDCRVGALGLAPRLMKSDLVTPPALASMRTVVKVATGLVVIVKLVELLPAGTEILAGTWTSDGLSLVSVTRPPPAGAGATSCTVPVVDAPPTTELGFTPIARSVVAPEPGVMVSSVA